jgi:hypothetical protein
MSVQRDVAAVEPALMLRNALLAFRCLVIPRGHVADHATCTIARCAPFTRLIEQVRHGIVDADPSVRAFNIGVNSGRIAGKRCSTRTII